MSAQREYRGCRGLASAYDYVLSLRIEIPCSLPQGASISKVPLTSRSGLLADRRLYPLHAIKSISIPTSFGSLETSTVALAGGSWEKYWP